MRERIAAVECRTPVDAVHPVHSAWGGTFACGALHEWFGASLPARPEWVPPLCLLSDLAARAVEEGSDRLVVWVGKRCRPSAFMLARSAAMARASIFLEPSSSAARLWVIDVASRSPGVAVVIGDGSGLSMPATRRLQLAAGQGGGLCMLGRPEWERGVLSAAQTRWLVRHEVSDERRPRWNVTLLREKARSGFMERSPAAPPSGGWLVEWNDEAGCIGVAAGMGRAACRQNIAAASA